MFKAVSSIDSSSEAVLNGMLSNYSFVCLMFIFSYSNLNVIISYIRPSFVKRSITLSGLDLSIVKGASFKRKCSD